MTSLYLVTKTHPQADWTALSLRCLPKDLVDTVMSACAFATVIKSINIKFWGPITLLWIV